MMAILTTQMSLLFLLLLSITTFHITMCSNHTLVRCNENHTLVRCNEKDRETLLTFKQGINDSFGMISTWSTEKDCCSWEGVHCDNITGRVIEIDLKGEPFDGVHDPVKVLKGTQLQSRDASSYIGNPKLCGAPLNNCTITEENPKTAMPSTENEDDESIKESLYLGMGVGFAAGFWGICGSLFLIRKWRHAYFRFIYGVGNRLYVTLMVKLNSFRRS
ncbi:receptor-like protein EIX2 isoform X2 [Medicago truncatula]|uniref:receptor-like protein EIX2 isoform X2 n=1 Tax=Medicago truncatula TaxID=3880 RepID=UPI0019673578|nr:receptor-like protein EIX2 isoform X2 [Medicago truncatula]